MPPLPIPLPPSATEPADSFLFPPPATPPPPPPPPVAVFCLLADSAFLCALAALCASLRTKKFQHGLNALEVSDSFITFKRSPFTCNALLSALVICCFFPPSAPAAGRCCCPVAWSPPAFCGEVEDLRAPAPLPLEAVEEEDDEVGECLWACCRGTLIVTYYSMCS